MSSTLNGQFRFYVNGEYVASRQGARFSPGGFERTAQISDFEVAGHTEQPVAPYCEGEFPWRQEMDLAALNAFCDGTVLFETNTGETWALRQAWRAGPPIEAVSGDANVSIRFEAKTAERV